MVPVRDIVGRVPRGTGKRHSRAHQISSILRKVHYSRRPSPSLICDCVHNTVRSSTSILMDRIVFLLIYPSVHTTRSHKLKLYVTYSTNSISRKRYIIIILCNYDSLTTIVSSISMGLNLHVQSARLVLKKNNSEQGLAIELHVGSFLSRSICKEYLLNRLAVCETSESLRKTISLACFSDVVGGIA